MNRTIHAAGIATARQVETRAESWLRAHEGPIFYVLLAAAFVLIPWLLP